MLGNLIVRNPSKKTIDSSESEVKADPSASNGDWRDFLKLSKCFLIKNYEIISRLRGIHRMGPHNKEVFSVIWGSLLGDGHADNRVNGVGTWITFYPQAVHVEYLLYLHKFLSDLGYCNPMIPVITKRLGTKGKLRKIVRFTTWIYTSFHGIHDTWYEINIKRVTESISEYFTPLALAIWIMDDGSKVSKGLKLCTNSFTYDDCTILIKALKDNLSTKASVQSAGSQNQYILYIWKESMNDLRKIVSPYIVAEMKYTLL